MRRIVIGLLIATSLSCWEEDIAGSTNTTGTYTLRTINGSALPFTSAGSGANRTEILDDAIMLYQGNTFAQTAHARVTANGQATITTTRRTGSYTTFGNSISMRNNEFDTVTGGVISGKQLTIMESGTSSVYSK